MVNIAFGNKVINDIELFVFDKDGTLIDLYNYWYYMIEMRAKDLCSFYKLDEEPHKNSLMSEMGINLEKRRLKPEGPVGILPRAIVQKAAEDYLVKLDYQDVSRVCFDIFKKVDDKSLFLLDKLIVPIKGAMELLKNIKEKKTMVAIATTDKTERAELAVKFLNIGNLVDIVVGEDKVKNSKPAPDMLMYILKKLDVSPRNSIMVGDANTDVLMGKNANLKASIGVCTGLTNKDKLLEITPYVVDDVSKIKIYDS
ncbi:MAG: HAD family hydrolase [Candidatus Gorgyraea atricola]|nr:HAD family hydrolase [Candidatus Gorgyraea atricola]